MEPNAEEPGVIQNVACYFFLLSFCVAVALIGGALQYSVGPLKAFVLVLPGLTKHRGTLAPETPSVRRGNGFSAQC